MAKLICVGHSALDRVFTVEAWPQVSAKLAAKAFAEIGGGMAANAAVAVARLGGEAHFWGPVGEDSVAEVMRAQLQAARAASCPGPEIFSVDAASRNRE